LRSNPGGDHILDPLPHPSPFQGEGVTGAEPDPPQHRKRLEQPITRFADEAGEEPNAGEHQQCPHRLLDHRQIGTEAREEFGERLDRERRHQERNAEAERINRKQAGPFGDRRLGRRDREDDGKDRPNARRPAEREGKSHHVSAP